MSKVFKEVKNEVCSVLEPVTAEQLAYSRLVYILYGACDHNLIVDEDCWPYSLRSCAVCGHGLGCV